MVFLVLTVWSLTTDNLELVDRPDTARQCPHHQLGCAVVDWVKRHLETPNTSVNVSTMIPNTRVEQYIRELPILMSAHTS